MKSLRHFIFSWGSVVTLIITIMLVTYCWQRVYLPKQYADFLKRERDVIPLFDALNDNVAQELPPLPPGSSLQEKASFGIEKLYAHGRYLIMNISTVQPSDFILEYYNNFLLNHGWTKDPIYYASDHATYLRDTSCIKIDASVSPHSEYRISIWHDYKSQSFTPVIPKYITRFEHGKTSFATCP